MHAPSPWALLAHRELAAGKIWQTYPPAAAYRCSELSTGPASWATTPTFPSCLWVSGARRTGTARRAYIALPVAYIALPACTAQAAQQRLPRPAWPAPTPAPAPSTPPPRSLRAIQSAAAAASLAAPITRCCGLACCSNHPFLSHPPARPPAVLTTTMLFSAAAAGAAHPDALINLLHHPGTGVSMLTAGDIPWHQVGGRAGVLVCPCGVNVASPAWRLRRLVPRTPGLAAAPPHSLPRARAPAPAAAAGAVLRPADHGPDPPDGGICASGRVVCGCRPHLHP